MAEQNNETILEKLDEDYVTAPTGGEEKVLFGAKLKDRRVIVLPWEDPRAIMKCIGRIRSDYGNHPISNKPIVNAGTGTVFCVKDGWAYIITCAHNTKTRDYQGTMMDVKSLQFRIVTEKYPYIKSFDVDKVAVHEQYQDAKMNKYDLAILKIKDHEQIFQNIFSKQQSEQKMDEEIVHLLSSDEIQSNSKFALHFGIYGFPISKDKHANKEIKKGKGNQLWGMTAPSRSYHDHNDDRLNMFCHKNDTQDLWEYNAIDTEGGQSGAAIFVTMADGTFGIVGVHTGGSKDDGKNWGVALNKNKIEWINSKMNEPKINTKWPDKFKNLWDIFRDSKSKEEVNQALENCNGDAQEAANMLSR